MHNFLSASYQILHAGWRVGGNFSFNPWWLILYCAGVESSRHILITSLGLTAATILNTGRCAVHQLHATGNTLIPILLPHSISSFSLNTNAVKSCSGASCGSLSSPRKIILERYGFYYIEDFLKANFTVVHLPDYYFFIMELLFPDISFSYSIFGETLSDAHP